MPVNLTQVAADFASAEALLQAVCEVSLTGVALCKPVYDGSGTLVDFTFAYLNPVAQLLLGLPAQPAVTCWQQLVEQGDGQQLFDFLRAAFLAGEQPTAAATVGQRFRLAGRRVGEGLLVSFSDEPRAAASEEMLLASQAREQAARQAAERERNLLQAVLMQAPMAIGLFQGEDQVVVTANDRLCAMWGYPPAQVLGKPLLEGVPELRAQGFTELMTEVARTRVPFVGQEVPANLRQNGRVERHYFDFVYQPLYDAAGGLLGILDIAIDVTPQVLARQRVQLLNEELAAANEELHAANEDLLTSNEALLTTQQQLRYLNQQLGQERALFQQVFAQTPALVALVEGPDHVFTFVNPAFEKFFPNRRFLGRPYAEVLPEAYAQRYGEWLGQVYTTGETVVANEISLLLCAPDGRERQVYLDFTYEAYGNPTPEGIFILAFDVTERVLARQQQVALQQLRAVFEHAPVAISVLRGPQYVVEVANPFILDMWGRPSEAIIRQPLFEVLPEFREQGFESLLHEVRQSGQPYVAQEVPIRFAQAPSKERVVNLSVYPVREEQEAEPSLVVVSTDVSDQLRARQQVQQLNEELAVINEELQVANEQLELANQQLTRTNVDLDNFIYTASHDLKAPITNIEGLLVALQGELPLAARVGDVDHILSLMLDSVNRFKRTIEHLTDVSRLQKEHGQASSTVPVAEIIENVRLDLAPLLQQTGARLEVDVLASVRLKFSEKNLRSVVYNLLSNALKYHHPNRIPYVRVRYLPQDKYQVLTVQDNGLGLDLTRKPELFSMFQRYHTHVEGSGIGLYMVKKMVENAGGRLAVQSELDQGSTFSVYFRR